MSLWKKTLMMRAFGLFKIPLIFIVRPVILRLDKKSCEVKIPLNYITKNHVGSMYFGVLAVGADLAGGLLMLDAIEASGKKVNFIFKDFTADFLKLAKSDVHFICHEGKKITTAVHETIKTGKRVNSTVNLIATTPKVSGDEPIAKFTLTVSVKLKS